MKIIQVLDLDGSTIKVDATNPSEPKIVSSLQCSELKNVAIGDVAELIFAKPVNANVEAVCVGYKGTDGNIYGKFDGNGESLFATKVQPEPAPEPKFKANAFINLTIPADNTGGLILDVEPRGIGADDSMADKDRLLPDTPLTEGLDIMLEGDTEAYRFEYVSKDETGLVYTLRSNKVYNKPLTDTLRVLFGKQSSHMEYAVTLTRSETLAGATYSGGKFGVEASSSEEHIINRLEVLDHL